MKLELGRRADYAIRAAVDLGRHHGQGRRKAKMIAETMDIPSTYVPQIMADLVRAGLIVSAAGRSGGYALGRTPAAISLLDVVEAVEGGQISDTCVLRGGPCQWADMCAVHVPWTHAQHALLESLAGTSLADIVVIDEALDAGTYELPAGVGRPASGPPVTRAG